MKFFDTFNENGVFMSAEDEHDVHYKGLWHKVARLWLYDAEGNLYLRRRKEDNKLDCLNELHVLSSESVSGCFDRGMFEKLNTHFPATSSFKQVTTKKVKKHKVFSDNSEIKDNYFLCDCIGEYDKTAKFFLFSPDTVGLVKCNAKGILNLITSRTGEVVCYNIDPTNPSKLTKEIITIENIYENSEEDTYEKYSYVVNEIDASALKHKKELREQEKMQELIEKKKPQIDDEEVPFVSHADENEGIDIY